MDLCRLDHYADALPFTERIATISGKMKSLAKDLEWIMEALNKPKMCKMNAKYHEYVPHE